MNLRSLIFSVLSVGCVLSACSYYIPEEDSMSATETDVEVRTVLSGPDTFACPAYGAEEDVVQHRGFILSYDHHYLTPAWVAYELTREEVLNDGVERLDTFQMDPEIKGLQAYLEDYRGSGWDRGHMAPSRDMQWSGQSMEECFFLSNVCPQNRTLNATSWNYAEQTARYVAKKYGSVCVVSGPIYGEGKVERIGGVAVPHAFFKALLIRGSSLTTGIAFVMRNTDEYQTQESCAVSIDSLENLIHRDLFPSLEDELENRVERAYQKKYWGNLKR